ncbi:potassium transport protein Kup [Rhodopseudomonas sp. AAP120]|jgi:KUP system potassium uptake protein|uniref:potassium transporter Kup n=1 Tax=Rhodopseudomonas sp. AAP120 TaxID=1523430 RepID=UPI0006B9C96D|nr:potassium transporter Kup [Rhodopseudomonas sp. AAP120]KPF98516.1 potassium transport protein Kup [Rhodopseudomonas sp. AAP120]
MSQHKSSVGLLISTVGVVFGDIGTSPLYALKETFAGHHPIAVTPDNIFGVLSLVFWTVMLLVTVKYVIIIMRADNHGEGGSLALLALVTELTRGRRVHYPLMMLGVIAAALFYGDSMITPAISVLSAVEGLEVVTPDLKLYVVPVTAVVLTALFAIQSRGTGLVGRLFGPVMTIWFVTLAVLGIVNIARSPGVLEAISPVYAVEFVIRHPLMSFYALGSVVLAVTGGEALYTDMGHFGRFPIRLAWFGLVLPALLLNYFGQGALLIHDPSAIQNPFFRMGPEWMVMPMVALATAAAVIASQAVISGAYSVARQAIQLGLLPRMTIVHTSGEEAGQIYVPFTNWTLYIAVMALVIGFQSSSNLAAAYGIAVTGTMMIDTILVSFVMALLWRWNMALVIAVIGTLLAVDFAFFAANIIKVAQGGWFPLFIGFISFTVLTTWRRGRALVRKQLKKQAVPLDVVLRALGPNVSRARGTAVFLTAATDGVPPALLHNLKHNQTVHQRVVLTTVMTAETPYVPDSERVLMTDIGDGFHRLIIRYGFMQTPDVPAALALCKQFGHEFNMMSTSFFLSRETFVPSLNPGMALWRERLFTFMTLNATRATTFFKIPTDRVVELGTQLEI